MSDTLVTLSKEAASSLQGLIKLNIDSAEGFNAAADRIEDSTLAAQFRKFGSQRSANAEELKSAVAYNGEEPSTSGTTAGTLHRWWLDIRGALTGGSAHQVLSEAERGEDAIKHAYEKALKMSAGSPINAALAEQFAGVKSTHDYVRDLRDSFAAAK